MTADPAKTQKRQIQDRINTELEKLANDERCAPADCRGEMAYLYRREGDEPIVSLEGDFDLNAAGLRALAAYASAAADILDRETGATAPKPQRAALDVVKAAAFDAVKAIYRDTQRKPTSVTIRVGRLLYEWIRMNPELALASFDHERRTITTNCVNAELVIELDRSAP